MSDLWTIPIIGARGERIGTVRMPADGSEPIIEGNPWPETGTIREIPVFPDRFPTFQVSMPAELGERLDSYLPSGRDALVEQLKESFGSVVDRMLEEPRYREAAERGRKVYERALALTREGLSYPEALEKVLGEGAG